ncbi:NAD-dependent epimerase/dehydratase family protein [Balneolales bacterium ANBcel1]|nr:NAD-dependent epimerase/dehydratase family protein [Balneolales bacterium ANBcel1]
MKAFVTGGTGFIGSHLVDELLKKPNDQIRCLVRSKDKWLHDKDIIRIKGNLQDLDALEEGIAGADVVYHIAGLVMASSQDQFDKANVEATENVLRLAMKHRVPKMVVLSSLAAAGPSFKRPVNEEDEMMPVTRYGESKKRMEEMIRNVADERISVTIIRPPAVYGPREDQIFSVFQMASWRLFPIIGDGQSARISLIHVDDLVAGILLAADEKEAGTETYFISSETDYTWDEIRHATQAAFGHKLFTLNIKPRIVEHIGAAAEFAASLIGRYPVINRDKAKELGMQWTCSVGKASGRLGFRQKVSLSDGIADTIAWYKRHHWL